MDPQLMQFKSDRKVRPVVIPTGKRARGRFPSLKSHGAALTYESLLEQQVLQICEVSNSVSSIDTHPAVLRLGKATPFHYTPDLTLTHTRFAERVVCEVKGDYFLRTPAQQNRLREIAEAFSDADIAFFVVLQSDLPMDLVHHTERALHRRSWPRNGTRTANQSTNPRQPDDSEWVHAAALCDSFLEHVMQRNIEETLALAMRTAGGVQ